MKKRDNHNNKYNNKNYLWIIYVGIALILISIMLLFSNSYTRRGWVEYNNGEELLFCDEQGNLWAWEIETMREMTEYQKGDKVLITFNINGTEDTPEDDIIIKFKKIP